MQLLDFQPHLHAQLGVQVGERFVEQEHGRLAHDGAAHGHALALAAGELARRAFQQRTQFQDGGRTLHALVDLGLGQALDLQAIRHVLVHRHVRIQRIVLEHHGDVALLGFQVIDHALADDDLSAADLFQPGDHAQERGFAAARGPDHDDEFAIGDVGIDAMDHVDRLGAGAIGLADLLEMDCCHDCQSLTLGMI